MANKNSQVKENLSKISSNNETYERLRQQAASLADQMSNILD